MKITPFAGDTITVHSNSDMSMLGTLTFIEDHDDPLTDTVDVTDDFIVESLDITNEPLGMDNSDLDGSIKNSTDSLTDSISDSLTEVTSSIADADAVDFTGFNSNEIEATSGSDVDLNFMASGDSAITDETQLTLFSGDNMTTANNDVFSTSNPGIPVFETPTYSAIEDADNSLFIQLIGNSENIDDEG